METDDRAVARLVAQVADALGQQAETHIDLAKAEIRRDVKAFGKDAIPFVAGILLAGFGYCSAAIAGAFALGTALGNPAGFGLIALVHVIAGAILLQRSVSHLGSRTLVAPTLGVEFARSAQGIVAALRVPNAPLVRDAHVR